MTCYISLKKFLKVVFNDNIFENINWNINNEKTKNPETIPSNLVCQWEVFDNDNILYIAEKSWKMPFNDNVFENVASNYYHPKPQAWYISN